VVNGVPTATYRVQLTSEFDFSSCAAILPYLSSLGILTLYCSPVLQARPGSTHGYDTVDPSRLSEELGGVEGWATLRAAARDCGMTVLLDIVPNHMAATVENPWWRDVLEHGRISPYSRVFDIDWESPWPWLRNRVMLPQLPAPPDRVISDGLLAVRLTDAVLVLRCGDIELPLDVRSWRHILSPLLTLPSGVVPVGFVRLVRAVAALQSVHEKPGSHPEIQYDLRTMLKQEMMAFLAGGATPGAGERTVAEFVGDAAARLPPETLRRVLREQNYVLEYWQQGRHALNYRRFFDINDLVGVRVEDEQVFELAHSLLRTLAASEVVCGFRVDHVDGLREPLSYLKRLRSLRVATEMDGTGRPPFVVVEKVLSGEESLPGNWPVEGTTGYDFLNEVAGLFVDPAGLRALDRHYRRTTRTRVTRAERTYDNKHNVLAQHFYADLATLAHTLLPVAEWLYPSSGISSRQLISALTAVTASLPVYRTYYSGRGALAEADRRYIESALERAGNQPGALEHPFAFDVVRRALTLDIPESAPARIRKAVREHLMRWQQLSSAAMAKGFEDTTLYQDSTLLSLNNVGGRESLAAITLDHFHAWNARRLKDWPQTMNCTATHDTKRGEDVRARIAVLSEMPEEWAVAVDRWFYTLRSDGTTAAVMQRVDPGTHVFLLQTIIGAWPETTDLRDYAGRLVEYMTKVAREAKTHSSWLEPDEEYERALAGLVEYAVVGEGVGRFHECFDTVIGAVRFHGLVNSVAQVLLKATCPGIPDFYQGTELLDLSLVDPDNRRLVDYAVRESLLRELAACGHNRPALVDDVVRSWPDERAKMYVMARALNVRLAHADVFRKGVYTPLDVGGQRSDHVCAFMRSRRDACIVVLAPLRSRSVAGHVRLPLGTDVWGAAAVTLPAGSPQVFQDAFTGANAQARDGRILVGEALSAYPVALLVGKSARRSDFRRV
jgi:(1->4)-alpha-D-glucan 1-alpha-D-glucosylmutase